MPPVACGRYSITVSANASSVDGMVRLRSFAVLRLSAKSKRVGMFHGQIRRLLAIEDMPGIHPDLAERVSDERAIAHEPAGLHEFAPGMNGR